MTAASLILLTYSVQVLVVVAVAAGAIATVPLTIPQARLQYWRAVAALCVGLPLVAMNRADSPGVFVALGPVTVTSVAGAEPGALLTIISGIVPWVVAAGVVARLAWLLLGAWRLRQLRVRSVLATVSTDLEEMRRVLAPKAQFRWTDRLHQPVAFGVRRPVVLLPRQFATLSPDAQRAVGCHELAHIARRDWLWIVAEEHLRAVLWFHPAVWWLLEEVHLSREQVVDQFVVARTGSRKAYMQALLVFADAGSTPAPAIAFLRRRHLVARLGQLSKEVRMSRMRLVCAVSLLMVVVAGATRAVVSALPLTLPAVFTQTSATGSEIRLVEPPPNGAVSAAGAAQARRIKVGGAVKPPVKVFDVRPEYPDDAQEAGIQGTVVLGIVIAGDGSVIDTEVLRSIPELDQAATDAVKQWQFEPTLLNGEPVEVEMSVTIQFTLT
jgi:TonB family protein